MSSTSRQSLGGRFAPVSKSNSRQSLAPASSRQSMGPRQSLAPATSRQSLAPSRPSMGGGGRQSLGARNALVDRKSGGRRSSGAAARGVRTDPRPIANKEYIRDSIRKLIVFLTGNNYDHPISQKQLNAPSTKDFNNILSFLFRKLDPNFQFPQGDGFAPAVIMYLKRFGYPFAISKSAMSSAGSPHTWPSLLAMLVWLVEAIQYHDTVFGSEVPLGTESDERMYFEYTSGAYGAFLAGQDNFTLFDETLAKKFEYKNQVVTEEVRKLQQRITDASGDIDIYKKAAAQFDEYQQFSKAAKTDIPVLEENIKNNRAYIEQIQTKRIARQHELEEKQGMLGKCKEENAYLAAALAKQPFTPLQVQEMLHQKATLEATLEQQKSQAQTLQSETFKAELEAAQLTTMIEKSLSELNELGLDVAAASSRSAVPYVHEEARFLPQGEKVETMLSLNLKAHKEHATLARDAVVAAKRELTLEAKKQESRLSRLAELQTERQASLELLAKRLGKLSDVYNAERTAMRKTVEESCAEVEDVELAIVRLRHTLTAGIEKVPASALAAIDAEIIRSEQQFLAEEATLKGEICAMMQELTEHKVAVQERLEQMLEQAEAIKQEIIGTDINKIE